MNLDVLSPTFETDNPDYNPKCHYCGSGRLAWLVPERFFSADFSRSCYLHDVGWDNAILNNDWEAAKMENVNLWHNIIKECQAKGINSLATKIVSEGYYEAVDGLFGWLTFKKDCYFNRPKHPAPPVDPNAK